MTIKQLVNRFINKCQNKNEIPKPRTKQENTKSWILGETKEIDMSDIDMCIEDDD